MPTPDWRDVRVSQISGKGERPRQRVSARDNNATGARCLSDRAKMAVADGPYCHGATMSNFERAVKLKHGNLPFGKADLAQSLSQHQSKRWPFVHNRSTKLHLTVAHLPDCYISAPNHKQIEDAKAY